MRSVKSERLAGVGEVRGLVGWGESGSGRGGIGGMSRDGQVEWRAEEGGEKKREREE